MEKLSKVEQEALEMLEESIDFGIKELLVIETNESLFAESTEIDIFDVLSESSEFENKKQKDLAQMERVFKGFEYSAKFKSKDLEKIKKIQDDIDKKGVKSKHAKQVNRLLSGLCNLIFVVEEIKHQWLTHPNTKSYKTDIERLYKLSLTSDVHEVAKKAKVLHTKVGAQKIPTLKVRNTTPSEKYAYKQSYAKYY